MKGIFEKSPKETKKKQWLKCSELL